MGAKRAMRNLVPARLRSALRALQTLRRGGRVVPGPLAYATDGLFTLHNADFLSEPGFAKAYAASDATGSWDGIEPLPWRVKVVCDVAARCAEIDGDFVECGVNKGGFAAAIIETLDFATVDKTMYLLDTFSGFDPSLLTPEEARAVGDAYHYEDCYERVRRTFAPYDNVRIIKGAVPGTLAQVDSDRVAYLSIDMNCVLPEIAAAEHFWDRLTPGAIVVLDDYGFAAHRAQKAAFDEFCRRRGAAVMPLPTGQGLIFKPLGAVRRRGLPTVHVRPAQTAAAVHG